MKNYKRAQRRHAGYCKYLRRLRTWNAMYTKGMPDERRWKWLKHTSTKCSCWMCSYEKYKRYRNEELSIIKEQLEDYYESGGGGVA